VALELVCDAQRQRQLGSDDRQVDAFVTPEAHEGGDVVYRQRYELRHLGNAGVAGRAKDALHTRRLADLPRQRMFASAATDDEDVHDKIRE